MIYLSEIKHRSCNCCGKKYPLAIEYFSNFYPEEAYKKICYYCFDKYNLPDNNWKKINKENISRCVNYWFDEVKIEHKEFNNKYFSRIEFQDLSADEMLIYLSLDSPVELFKIQKISNLELNPKETDAEKILKIIDRAYSHRNGIDYVRHRVEQMIYKQQKNDTIK